MAPSLQARTSGNQEGDRKRQRWLERVDNELAIADRWEPHRSPESISTHLDRMEENSSKTDTLSQSDKINVRDRVRVTKLKLYERHVDDLLSRVIAAARDKERQQEKLALLKQVSEAFSVAARLGASQSVKDSVKERLDIIRQTSAAGDSSKAKADAEREASRHQKAHPNEHRTFARWRDPPLVVVIDGKAFDAVDWSLGGVLIADIEGQGWAPGQQLDVKLGLSPDRLYSEKIEVVRYIAEMKRLAIKSRRFASVLMQIKRDCEAAGIEPS